MSPARRVAVAVLAALLLAVHARAQRADSLPPDLVTMIDTERAFAARALGVGWKQAFLEYFADDAIGFERNEVGLAKGQISRQPDPPKDLKLQWEPRYGDVSTTGEIGYLIGPVQTVRASSAAGQKATVRHSNYASIWKKQTDGTYRVILDFGTATPGPVPYAPGFTRAPHANRFTGDYDDTTPPLGAADSILNSSLRSAPARAYRGHVADGARLLRPGRLPIVGAPAIAAWAGGERAYTAADTRFTESARSGDLGYTWGTYAWPARGRGAGEKGFYVRVWVRERNGQWKLALDALQPQ